MAMENPWANPQLGRGVVVLPGQPGRDHWPRVRVDADTLQSPDEAIAMLYRHWVCREPVVVELAVSPETLKAPQTDSRPTHELGPDFAFQLEQLHFLVWANNVDATRPEGPVWWHDRVAARLGAEIDRIWCDGGPRDQVALSTLHRETMGLKQARPKPSREINLAQLTPSQREAVAHGAGAARVIAPAGSGKTRVLTRRLEYLLSVRGVEPEILTVVAYNVRARQELQQRTAHLGRLQIRTVHSLAYAILREHTNPKPITELEVRSLLKRLVPNKDQTLNQDYLGPYIEALGRARLALMEPEQVEDERLDVPHFAAVFEAYRRQLRNRNLVDYDEMIVSAIEAVCQDAALRKRWQQRCRHLLVDEFQDLTPAFVLLLRLLAAPGYQVFGVGDDDQVIYGYAGADPDFLVSFRDYFPQAAFYDLGVNFRCPTQVVDAARCLLSRNGVRVEKRIEAAPQAVPGGLMLTTVSSDQEAQSALAQVQNWLREGSEPRDIAILCRVNALLLPLKLGLFRLGIPHNSPLGPELLNRTGLRTALSYLQVAEGEFTAAELVETLKRPSRRLRRTRLDELRGNGWTLDRFLEVAQKWDDWEYDICYEYTQDMRRLSRTLKKKGPAAALRFVKSDLGLAEAMDSLDQSSGKSIGSPHGDDLDALLQAAVGLQSLNELEELLRAALASPDSEGVTLSSVHRVKGQEWPRVILYGVRRGVMPHRLSEDLEEERRVFHVGLTRCSREVVITTDTAQLSPFLEELRPEPQLEEGVAVSHGQFGGGVVVGFKAGKVIVEFKNGCRRKVQKKMLKIDVETLSK